MTTTVFTNGCFDILHPGHVSLLERARALGDRLVVGINSDESVRKIKGPGRPVVDQESRKSVLLALKAVDEVIIFEELTPERLIHDLKPEILVKGGDWKEDEIIGADFVKARGGKVFSLPLEPGFSSSKLIDSMNTEAPERLDASEKAGNSIVEASFEEHQNVFARTDKVLFDTIESSARLFVSTLENGGKILICGNGGSAADAQHLAAEFSGRYEKERRALPAVALTTDTSALTAIANDYGFERVFARQVEALARPGDCLIAISTSGNSPNVIAAVMAAREIGCTVVGLTGESGKKLASLCDECVLVPSSRTARIQEIHITIAHIWCEYVDAFAASEQ
ncbi:MAG: D-glycero-beta-D-manno-heptose 1-phosphate adenylyltransferase [Acidobacteria bacterium]|nr:D-glycero-beta-D-manno-heptose 1-phosphate adenylyltransferase [Acidobacteriota bacterium]